MAYTPVHLVELDEHIAIKPVEYVELNSDGYALTKFERGHSTEFNGNNRATRRNRRPFQGQGRKLPLHYIGKRGGTPGSLSAKPTGKPRWALNSSD